MTNPFFGRVVHRIEDPRFLTGRGRFVETVRPRGALRAVFVRSIIAHGRLEGVDVDAASSMPGVVAVLTAAHLSLPDPVEGQVHGWARAGDRTGAVRAVVYDELGTPLTSNLSTYRMPAAAELPSFERGVLETPTPLNPLGAKGIGESATVGSTPAVVNAVVDALSPFGVRHLDPPLTPERVWRAIHDARDRNA